VSNEGPNRGARGIRWRRGIPAGARRPGRLMNGPRNLLDPDRGRLEPAHEEDWTRAYDIVIASRAAAPSRTSRSGSPGYRENSGRLFQLSCVRLPRPARPPGPRKCGFKLFRAEAAEQAVSAPFAPRRVLLRRRGASSSARPAAASASRRCRHLAQRRGHARRHLQGPPSPFRGPGADPVERMGAGPYRTVPGPRAPRRFPRFVGGSRRPGRRFLDPSLDAGRDTSFLDEAGRGSRGRRPPRTEGALALVPPPRRPPGARPLVAHAAPGGRKPETPRTFQDGGLAGGPGGGAAPPRPRLTGGHSRGRRHLRKRACSSSSVRRAGPGQPGPPPRYMSCLVDEARPGAWRSRVAAHLLERARPRRGSTGRPSTTARGIRSHHPRPGPGGRARRRSTGHEPAQNAWPMVKLGDGRAFSPRPAVELVAPVETQRDRGPPLVAHPEGPAV